MRATPRRSSLTLTSARSTPSCDVQTVNVIQSRAGPSRCQGSLDVIQSRKPVFFQDRTRTVQTVLLLRVLLLRLHALSEAAARRRSTQRTWLRSCGAHEAPPRGARVHSVPHVLGPPGPLARPAPGPGGLASGPGPRRAVCQTRRRPRRRRAREPPSQQLGGTGQAAWGTVAPASGGGSARQLTLCIATSGVWHSVTRRHVAVCTHWHQEARAGS